VDNQIQTTTTMNAVSAPMMEVTQNLAENLAQSEPFLRFRAAQNKLNADAEAQHLLTELSEIQQKVRSNQYSDAISESELKRLRELQTATNLNETIQEYGLAQEYAVAFLREVNREISQLIGIDFASLTRRSSGCC
jgi:cell fate (sporulation/competence/biofilm development) regulator YlbF (YheA/YmcA/DUF963 family)